MSALQVTWILFFFPILILLFTHWRLKPWLLKSHYEAFIYPKFSHTADPFTLAVRNTQTPDCSSQEWVQCLARGCSFSDSQQKLTSVFPCLSHSHKSNKTNSNASPKNNGLPHSLEYHEGQSSSVLHTFVLEDADGASCFTWTECFQRRRLIIHRPFL